MPHPPLLEAINRHHSYLCTQLKSRKKNNHHLKWIFHKSTPHFVPDYLKIAHFGRNKIEKYANQLTNKVAQPLWKKTIFNKILSHALSILEKKYLIKNNK